MDTKLVSLPQNLRFDHEISQDANLNGTSRLWIQNNGTVYKQYVIYNDLTEKNIHNLLQIAKIGKLYRIPEISMPLNIYEQDAHITGYLMKYHDMKPLEDYMRARRELPIILRAFHQLSDVINRLPQQVFIGDLHPGNILVSGQEIRLIDIDGFSLKNGEQISCPLTRFADHGILRKRKYTDKHGKFKISRDTDIFCVLWLFLDYIMQVNPFHYTENEIQRYLLYLRSLGFPHQIIKMLSRAIGNGHNFLIPSAFEQITEEMLEQSSYITFRNAVLS